MANNKKYIDHITAATKAAELPKALTNHMRILDIIQGPAYKAAKGAIGIGYQDTIEAIRKSVLPSAAVEAASLQQSRVIDRIQFDALGKAASSVLGDRSLFYESMQKFINGMGVGSFKSSYLDNINAAYSTVLQPHHEATNKALEHLKSLTNEFAMVKESAMQAALRNIEPSPPLRLIPPVAQTNKVPVNNEAANFIKDLIAEFEESKAEGRKVAIVCEPPNGEAFVVEKLKVVGVLITAYGIRPGVKHTRTYSKIDLYIAELDGGDDLDDPEEENDPVIN